MKHDQGNGPCQILRWLHDVPFLAHRFLARPPPLPGRCGSSAMAVGADSRASYVGILVVEANYIHRCR
jgi:hypothetical protein